MKVGDMMNKNPTTVSPGDSMKTLLCLQNARQSRLLHVVDDQGKLLGVISSYDLLKLMVPFYLNANLAKAMPESPYFSKEAFEENRNKTAAEIMEKKISALRPEDSFIEAESLIAEKGFNALPVVDGQGRLVGEVGRREALLRVVEQCGCCREEDA